MKLRFTIRWMKMTKTYFQGVSHDDSSSPPGMKIKVIFRGEQSLRFNENSPQAKKIMQE